MNILIVSQYFWPESFIINDLAKTLRDQGHTIVVATGKPNYPEGITYAGYTSSGVQKEIYSNNIEVIRVPLRPRGSGSAISLVLNYISFVWSGLRWFGSLLKGYKFDTILVFALSPITLAIPAIPLRRQKNAHLVLWIQDLWPDSLKATGFIRNKFLLWLIGWMVRGIYAFADTLLVQSCAFVGPVSRYARKDKIIYYPNSYLNPTEHRTVITTVPKDLLDEIGQHFSIVFAGNLGTAQSVETIVQASQYLRHLPDCKLVLVGSGYMLDWLRQKKMMHKLENLVLVGRFPNTDMPRIFEKAAGLLVTLKKEEIFSYTIPSKIQTYLAAGRPIIAALDGEGARIINEAGAGLTCPAEDAENLARNIDRLFHMAESEREVFGRSGRNYYLEHFEMQRQCKRLIEILESRINDKEN